MQKIQFNEFASVVGRREALRCLGIGTVAAALTACGGSDDTSSPTGSRSNPGSGEGAGTSVPGQTLLAFTRGTWKVTFPMDTDREPLTLTIADGTWSATPAEPKKGTWKFTSGTLQISDWDGEGKVGTATGVPETVHETAVPSTLTWAWKPDDSNADQLAPKLRWDKATKTMTITGTSSEGDPLVIEAKRS